MVGLEGENLVVCLFRQSSGSKCRLIHLLSCLTHCADILQKVLIDSELVSVFLAHDIDVSSKSAVLSLDVIVANECLIELILKKADLVLILLHLSSRRSHGLQMFALFSQFDQHLLVLVLQYHQTSIQEVSYYRPLFVVMTSIKYLSTLSRQINPKTYFFSCSNFLVKLSASRYRR